MIKYPEHVYVFAKDINGIWHVRKDDFWEKDLNAETNAHAVCSDIWSCEVSSVPPVLLTGSGKQKHCRKCFPLR
jgi:hypothetical protein